MFNGFDDIYLINLTHAKKYLLFAVIRHMAKNLLVIVVSGKVRHLHTHHTSKVIIAYHHHVSHTIQYPYFMFSVVVPLMGIWFHQSSSGHSNYLLRGI